MPVNAKPLAALIGTALLASCATTGQPKQQILATATLLSGNGTVTGAITLGRTGDELNLAAEARGLPPGLHGIHLHAVGRCEPRGFSSAGPHLNPFDRKHGTLNPAGSHLGDLPNLEVGADGTGQLEFRLSEAPDKALAAIFDDDGTAVVIHAGPDDYRTDPSGASGERIACGVFARVR